MLSSDEMPGWRNGRRYGLKIAAKPKNEISRDQMNQYLPTLRIPVIVSSDSGST
jgi:hypothetical protein